MVDRATLSRRLDALAGYLERLRAFQAVPEAEFVARPELHDLAERYLHLAVEAVLDIAHHLIADRGLETPETNAAAFEKLTRAGHMEAGLAARLQGWARFRNVLVHLYLDIDHKRTYAVIQSELNDLNDFLAWGTARLP
ncbi:DUF86 domain-containing protein [bacterium CPR1]|nr:DUF86 domain-containing protein [bacterium CPR1]